MIVKNLRNDLIKELNEKLVIEAQIFSEWQEILDKLKSGDCDEEFKKNLKKRVHEMIQQKKREKMLSDKWLEQRNLKILSMKPHRLGLSKQHLPLKTSSISAVAESIANSKASVTADDNSFSPSIVKVETQVKSTQQISSQDTFVEVSPKTEIEPVSGALDLSEEEKSNLTKNDFANQTQADLSVSNDVSIQRTASNTCKVKVEQEPIRECLLADVPSESSNDTIESVDNNDKKEKVVVKIPEESQVQSKQDSKNVEIKLEPNEVAENDNKASSTENIEAITSKPIPRGRGRRKSIVGTPQTSLKNTRSTRSSMTSNIKVEPNTVRSVDEESMEPRSVGEATMDSCMSEESNDTALSSMTNNDEDFVKFKRSSSAVFSFIQDHRYASLILNPPILNEDAFEKNVHCKVDLPSIKKRLESKQITNSDALKKEILLLFSNILISIDGGLIQPERKTKVQEFLGDVSRFFETNNSNSRQVRKRERISEVSCYFFVSLFHFFCFSPATDGKLVDLFPMIVQTGQTN